jgi:hypothetical protein
MRFCRVLSLAVVLAAASAGQAGAQFGPMPGMPGMPGVPMGPDMPGAPGMPGAQGVPRFGPPVGQPAGPPPACQQLMALRDETQKNGLAVQAASKRKATPVEACKLFTTFVASESKFVRGLEENKAQCGVPDEIIKRSKVEVEQVTKIKTQICEMAAQGPQNAGPSLSDALNSTPTLPDSTNTKPNTGTFDTLMGNPLVTRPQ